MTTKSLISIGKQYILTVKSRMQDLDNVMEHIEESQTTLDECHRVTSAQGGLVIAVPGRRGFDFDLDHKRFYAQSDLRQLDARWQLQSVFAAPFGVTSEILSDAVRQYCLVATYRKIG